jgi:hypothetical protein
MRCGAHIFSKGAGRVDAMLNLVQVGMDAVRDCDCHHRAHQGRSPSRADMLRIAAIREGVSALLIVETVQAVRACPRHSTFAASSVWLREHFPQDVAEAAISIVKGVYE